MRIFTSKIEDIYFNLALENYLLTEYIKSERILFTYSNAPCVVIGRFQNPWIECNLKKMHEEGVELVRRQSGGGTVYHDQMNINFSFLAPKKLHDKNWNHTLVVSALKKLGVSAIFTERGDIRENGPDKCKISGSAFKEKKDTAFHHGTMLIKSDLAKLNLYIHSNKDQLESKSIASKRSVVTNLTAINPKITNDSFIYALEQEFDVLEPSTVITKSHPWFKQIIDGNYYQLLKSHAWKYLETPKFYVEESFDEFEISLEIKKTNIEAIELNHNDYHPVLLSMVSSQLLGKSLFEIESVLEQMNISDFKDAHLLSDWFNEYFELKTLP